MSCGSTNRISINETNPLSLPHLGWSWHVPLAWLARIALAGWRRQKFADLLDLDDRLLADIGVSREAVEDALNSPWTDMMTRYVDR